MKNILSRSGAGSYFQKRPADDRAQLARSFDTLTVWLRRHVVLASMLVLTCSIAPRVLLTAVAEPVELLRPDSATYLAPAVNLANHGAFLDGKDEPEVQRTPGYPVFLAGIMWLTGRTLTGADLGAVLNVQAIILSCGPLFLYWFARRILPPLMAFTGALLAAFSPWGAVLAGVPLTEGLFICLLALVFLFMKLVQDARKLIYALLGSTAVGALTAAAILVRPMWQLLVFVVAGLFLHYGPRRRGALLVVLVAVVIAATPLFLWKARNMHVAQFDGLSDISGKGAWLNLASRVKAQLDGNDRFAIEHAARLDELNWGLSVQEADEERWRRAKEVFRAHPFVTAYSFMLSATEHLVHPSPDILLSARLKFKGDYWVLAVLWGGMLILAYRGWHDMPDRDSDDGPIDRRWLGTVLTISLLLTLASGISFGGGSRYRAPVELIVPLLAGIGLVRLVHPARSR